VAEDICYHDEATLAKVKHALVTDVPLSEEDADWAITALINRGILFREKLPYI
jgi:hypothetical protein